MRTVFADTGYWSALLNPRDQLQSKAMEVSRTLGQVRIVTTEMVLTELLTMMGRNEVLRVIAHRTVQSILDDPNVEVVPQTSLQFRRALELYGQRPDKEWSLTDCASFELMRARGIRDALAHDVHFAQAGFEPLLR